jgi:hypothetical protein
VYSYCTSLARCLPWFLVLLNNRKGDPCFERLVIARMQRSLGVFARQLWKKMKLKLVRFIS